MKPMLTTVVARVKAVDTCALGTKAVVEETRQLAATTAIRDAMIETDFIVMDIVGREEFVKVQGVKLQNGLFWQHQR
jgi:BMFP domain-containing protein YqiC